MSTTIRPQDLALASDRQTELLDSVRAKLGRVPNLLQTLAHSPASLKAYLELSGALGEGSLSAGMREKVALLVGQENGCDYCLAAHTTIGRSVGLSAEEMGDASPTRDGGLPCCQSPGLGSISSRSAGGQA